MLQRLLILLCILTLFSCQKEINDDRKQVEIAVQFNAVAGTQPLVFENTYSNPFGEDFTVTSFKFYIHNVQLGSLTGSASVNTGEAHTLVDFDATKENTVVAGVVPEGRYRLLSFSIGVDSVRNFSGAQTGALDPLHGMFWTWNSGYIMAKMEGASDFAATPGNTLEYHIGGFSGEQNVVKKVTLLFPEEIEVAEKITISINADILKWFSGNYDIRIAENPVCMTPGELAVKIAGNYANMFTIEEVK